METSSIAYQPTSYVSSPPEPAQIPLLYRPVFWLLQCVLKFALGEQYTQDLRDLEIETQLAGLNRAQKESLTQFKSEDDLIDLERRILVSRVFSRGLTPTQYLERKARLFIHGRARAYGLRHWGSRRQRQAQLSCFDHGTWAAPTSASLCDGLWDAQLPPD